MDKISRMLLLYSKLTQGEKISKWSFCMETDSNTRSFERDIEDIRLYLAEMFRTEELLYSRSENAYYLSGYQRHELEETEYRFIERILLDTNLLREDEISILLGHLASNTQESKSMVQHSLKLLEMYNEPIHKKALLKIQGDLSSITDRHAVIEIEYQKMSGEIIKWKVIPCFVKFDLGYMYLVAYKEKNLDGYPTYFRLDRINQFQVIRSQFKEEEQTVRQYKEKYAAGITQMHGGEFKEIIIVCKRSFYHVVHDKFKAVEVLEDNKEQMKIVIKGFEEGVVKWIVSQPTELVTVLAPKETTDLIKKKIELLRKQY